MKKRKMKGLTGLKKEQLIEKLKKEIKSQRTMGGGVMKMSTGVGKVKREEVEEKEEEEGQEVHDKGVHHGEKGGEDKEDEGTQRNRVEDRGIKVGGADKVADKRARDIGKEGVDSEVKMEGKGGEEVHDKRVRHGGKSKGWWRR